MTKQQIAKLIIFPLVIIGVTAILALYVCVPLPMGHYGGFYMEKENTLDFVCIGSSTVREGFSPTQAEKEFGYKSYNISYSPIHQAIVKIAMQEIVRTQKPKVVYIDVVNLTYIEEKNENERKYDARMASEDYIACITNEGVRKKYYKDLGITPDIKYGNPLYSFYNYHNQWRNFEGWDDKGFVAINRSSTIMPKTDYTPEPIEISDYNKNMLGFYISYAKEHSEIKWIFGNMPKFITDGLVEQTNKVEWIKQKIRSGGLEFYDFQEYMGENGINLDPKKDFSDGQHMNRHGAEKFTRWWLQHMIEHHF
ncbi:MAG: hypothetical protein LBH47_01855 [Christensenellaceae bacterium]|jgi:hypothetical protein|nr:hypothetical protein [Christensenellaceae bacterium]